MVGSEEDGKRMWIIVDSEDDALFISQFPQQCVLFFHVIHLGLARLSVLTSTRPTPMVPSATWIRPPVGQHIGSR